MARNPLYAAMLAASRERRQPQRFRTDLTTHDRRFVADPARPKLFGWVLYDWGTHLTRGQYASPSWRQLVQAFETDCPNPHYYIAAGDTLTAVDCETFASVLAAPRCRACGLATDAECPIAFACRCRLTERTDP